MEYGKLWNMENNDYHGNVEDTEKKDLSAKGAKPSKLSWATFSNLKSILMVNS